MQSFLLSSLLSKSYVTKNQTNNKTKQIKACKLYHILIYLLYYFIYSIRECPKEGYEGGEGPRGQSICGTAEAPHFVVPLPGIMPELGTKLLLLLKYFFKTHFSENF